jgi:hypothetical protein
LTLAKVTVFSLASSAQAPLATGVLQLVPSVLTEMEYLPIFPFFDPSDRGR